VGCFSHCGDFMFWRSNRLSYTIYLAIERPFLHDFSHCVKQQPSSSAVQQQSWHRPFNQQLCPFNQSSQPTRLLLWKCFLRLSHPMWLQQILLMLRMRNHRPQIRLKRKAVHRNPKLHMISSATIKLLTLPLQRCTFLRRQSPCVVVYGVWRPTILRCGDWPIR
jgi:hypothetical protein